MDEVTKDAFNTSDTKNRSYELKADHPHLGKIGDKFSAWHYGSNLAWVTGKGPIVNYSEIDKLVEEGKAIAL